MVNIGSERKCIYVYIQASNVYRCFLHKTIYQTQMKIRVSPEEDRQVKSFFNFFTSEVVRPRFSLTFYIRLCCEVWTGNLTDPP